MSAHDQFSVDVVCSHFCICPMRLFRSLFGIYPWWLEFARRKSLYLLSLRHLLRHRIVGWSLSCFWRWNLLLGCVMILASRTAEIAVFRVSSVALLHLCGAGFLPDQSRWWYLHSVVFIFPVPFHFVSNDPKIFMLYLCIYFCKHVLFSWFL